MNKINLYFTFVVLLALATFPMRVHAEMAHPQPVTVSQPDGTSLTLSLVGDEFFHYTTTTDGFTIVQNATGHWEYARMVGNELEASGILAHNATDRTSDELSFLASQPRHAFSVSTRNKAKAMRQRNETERQNDELFDYPNFKGLLILINYNDKKFSMNDPKSFYEQMMNTKNYSGFTWQGSRQACPGSVRDYFYDNSNGIFEPNFDVYGPVDVDLSCTSAQGSSNAEPIFKAAMDALDDEVDFSKYDTDGDGFIDMIFFLVAGYAASYSGNNSGYLWPHKYYLFDSANGSCFVYDGVCPWVYASSTETYGWESYGYTVPNGIGTMCHEFSHVLGLPDLYDTDYESSGQSHHPGNWDVMAGGNHSGQGRYPVGYSLYERYALGFAHPEEISAPGEYRIPELTSSNTGYIMRSEVANEFFMFENRQNNNKWERYLPGHGMLVARVDSTNMRIWDMNRVNADPSHNYYELLRAGGGTSGESDSDPFPGTSNVTTLTNSTPANLRTWNGTFSPLVLQGINERNSIINFTVKQESDIMKIVEDFEAMPIVSGTAEKNVRGNFASWSFNKSNVAKSATDDNPENHAVATVTPCALAMDEPINVNLYQLSMSVNNATSVEAKYRLYYKENVDDAWIQANVDDIAVPAKTSGIYTWPFSHSGNVMLRVNQTSGSKNAKAYIDNLVFTCDFVKGDVNLDGIINVTDVTLLVNMILGEIPQYDAIADINDDGEVNVSDVTELINRILHN